MKCERCGYDNPDYLEYCQNCTAPLIKEKEESGREPSWGFVKAPKWSKPDFSADTVSDNDIPDDFINGRKAASAAAAEAVNKGRHVSEVVGDAYDDLEDEIEDELHELNNKGSGIKQRAAAVAGRLKKHGKEKKNYEEDFEDRPRINEDEFFGDDFEEEDYDDNDGSSSGGRSLRPLITIVGILAALAVLAAGIWLIVKSAKGCSTRERTYDPPVVEQGEEGTNCYYVTIHAAEGTNLVYETADGGRTPYTVPESCIAKFKVPVSGLLPGEPIEGSVYYATPKVFIVNEDGTETPISIDAISIPVPELGLTLDKEAITADNGRAVVSGHVDYVNAAVTLNGEQVEVGEDGSFSKEYEYDEEGTYTVAVEAKLPNYRIANGSVSITVDAPVVYDPDVIIQMPWEYGDTTFSQRVVNSVQSIDVRGKVPEGSTVAVSSESVNATFTEPTVDEDGTFHFTMTMANPGDYTVNVACTVPGGETYNREIHLQRQPDYRNYISGALSADYSAFSYGNSQQYKIAGTVREIVKEGDYYLARFEMTDGHSIILEYHNHYGSAGAIEVGKSYSEIYGRSKGFDDQGNIVFYVWFIND